MADTRGLLTTSDYSDGYYEEHVAAGLDYLAFGEWHLAYARMITDATLQRSFARPAVLDAGCACGAQLLGFKHTGAFNQVIGIDMSRDMIELGKRHLGFTNAELFAGSVAEIPLADDTLTLINSGQVLEHIPDEVIDAVFAEFYRALAPGGRMFHNLAALKHGEPPDYHDGDPTHVNVKPTAYWMAKLVKAGFLPDFESYDRFARSPESPGGDYPNFFSTYDIWTCFAVMKPDRG